MVALTLSNLACAVGELGDMVVKKELMLQALAIQEVLNSPRHVKIAVVKGGEEK